MAVVQGNKALASDYNTLRDEINKWFADPNSSMTWGNGDQTWGWGGSAVSAVSQGNSMTATQMNRLIDRCNIGEDICNSVSGSLSSIVTGNLITAAEFNAIESKSDDINTNRLDIEAAELSLSGGGSTVRSSSWSGATILASFRYIFTDFAHARYFFNSGGAITITAGISGYSTGTGWDGEGFNEIFSNMGTVLMNYTQTTRSGSGGTPTSIGYYDLTTTNQTIYSASGSGAYSDAYFVIEAKRSTSGNYVEITVEGTPETSRSVDGTTTISTQYRKLGNQSSGSASLTITAPSYSSLI